MKGNRGRKGFNHRNKVGDSARTRIHTNNLNAWDETENDGEKKKDPTKENKEKENKSKEEKGKSIGSQYEWWELIFLFVVSVYMCTGSYRPEMRPIGTDPFTDRIQYIYWTAFIYVAAFLFCVYVYLKAGSILKKGQNTREGNDNNHPVHV